MSVTKVNKLLREMNIWVSEVYKLRQQRCVLAWGLALSVAVNLIQFIVGVFF